MEKPAYFALLAVSIVTTAASLGFSTSRYLGARHYTPPSAGVRAAGAAAREEIPPPERWTNLFAPSQGMSVPSRLAGAGGSAAASATSYVLLGTISSDSPSDRRAIFWTEGMKEPKMLRENAEIEPGVRLARVERERVLLSRGGKNETLEILPVGSRTRAAAAPPAPPAPAAAKAAPAGTEETVAPGIRVNRIGENTYSMDEASVAQLTGNINQYMTQVRLIPYFEGNKSSGYRLAGLRPGSAFEQLGFRGGDIIRQVNGVDLSSPEKVYTIFQNLKDQKRVTVDILRQGQKSSLTYEIR